MDCDIDIFSKSFMEAIYKQLKLKDYVECAILIKF